MPMDRRTMLVGALAAAAMAGAAAVVSRRRGHREPDPVEQSARPWRRSDPDVLFRPGARVVLPDGVGVVTNPQPAGRLRLPTGRLVAADPSWLPSWQRLRIAPYTTTVPAGSYPLTLAVGRFRTDQADAGTIVTAARLTIRDEPVAAWELALRPGEDPATLPDDGFFGVGVDVATVCLFDAAALTAMARRAADQPDAFVVWHGDKTVEVTDPRSTANLIAFQSGLGDGHYPVWTGRTATGRTACFVVDLLVGPVSA